MRIRARTGPIVLGALLATAPQLVSGQTLAKNLSVRFTDMRPLSVTLRLEMISREEGVIGKWESEAVTIEPGKTYSGVPWIAAPNGRQPYKAPGLGDGGNITLGRFVVINHEEQYVPRECEDATHALWIDVGQCDGCMAEHGRPMLCLRVEG